jgi:hypothetical protein
MAKRALSRTHSFAAAAPFAFAFRPHGLTIENACCSIFESLRPLDNKTPDAKQRGHSFVLPKQVKSYVSITSRRLCKYTPHLPANDEACGVGDEIFLSLDCLTPWDQCCRTQEVRSRSMPNHQTQTDELHSPATLATLPKRPVSSRSRTSRSRSRSFSLSVSSAHGKNALALDRSSKRANSILSFLRHFREVSSCRSRSISPSIISIHAECAKSLCCQPQLSSHFVGVPGIFGAWIVSHQPRPAASVATTDLALSSSTAHAQSCCYQVSRDRKTQQSIHGKRTNLTPICCRAAEFATVHSDVARTWKHAAYLRSISACSCCIWACH